MTQEDLVEVIKQLVKICNHQQNILESNYGTRSFVSELSELDKARKLLNTTTDLFKYHNNFSA